MAVMSSEQNKYREELMQMVNEFGAEDGNEFFARGLTLRQARGVVAARELLADRMPFMTTEKDEK